MASAGNDGDDRVEVTDQERECMACRGSGSVVSNLGGTESKVTCPWCRGTGRRLGDIDAQAHWAQAEAGGGAEAGEDGEGETSKGDDGPGGGEGDSAA
jgi:hypothetical protein